MDAIRLRAAVPLFHKFRFSNWLAIASSLQVYKFFDFLASRRFTHRPTYGAEIAGNAGCFTSFDFVF